MSKINELRAQRAKTWEQTKAFLDSHRSDKGVLSAEDTATYEKMEQEIVDLGREIERQERLDAFERELNTPINTPITQKPDTAKVDTKTGRASDTYKKAFWAQARTKGGMMTAEIRNALQEGVDSEGGYLVPDEFEQTLVQSLEAENVVRSLAHVITTASGSHKIPIVATKGTAAWVDEEGTIPEGDDAFGQGVQAAMEGLGRFAHVAEDDGVAGQQGRDRVADAGGEREVPWGDDEDDTERTSMDR